MPKQKIDVFQTRDRRAVKEIKDIQAFQILSDGLQTF